MKRKKLIIMAQPSKKWFLWEIAKTYKSESEKYWDEIEILDLYDKKNFQPNLEFEDMKVLNEDPNRKLFQEKITNADELIFIFPIWWGNMPAIMKNFIDTNFEAGFAYKFQKGSSIPKKLLKWKSARVFTTCDGFKIIYNHYVCPIFLEKYIEMYILWIFGIELKSFKLFDKMRKRTREEKDEILEDIKLDIKRTKMTTGFRKIIKNILN